MHEPKLSVHKVMVEMGAFARLNDQMNLFAGSIATHRVGVTGFDCAKERY
jgi:hypothetical protein